MTSIGIVFPPQQPPERLRDVALAAEGAGVEFWLWEDCFAESGVAPAAAVLAWTSQLRVGISLMPVPLRNVPLAAMEIATIERLFPGRFVPGIGHGVLDWMGQAGARAKSPVTLLREYSSAMRSLLEGESVTTHGDYVHLDDVRRSVRIALDARSARGVDAPFDVTMTVMVSVDMSADDIERAIRPYVDAGVTRIPICGVDAEGNPDGSDRILRLVELLRRFYFDEHPGVGNPAEINSVDIAIQEAEQEDAVSQILTVNLYTLASDVPVDTIPVESLAMIGSGSVTISPADDGSIVNVPVSATVSDTDAFDLVVEATVAGVFTIGATDTGETHPGFLLAPACGAVTPVRIDSIQNFEDTHIIMVVNASEGEPVACDNPATLPWLSVTPDAGSTGAGETDAVSVTVDAGTLAPGDHEAVLCVNSDDPDSPLVEVPVALTVQPGPAPELAFDPASFDFGDVEVGTTSASQTATLQNTGDVDVTGITFTLPGSGFDADTSACDDTLPVGASCPVSVTFSPGEPGEAGATLQVDSDEGASAAAELSGNGIGDGAFTAMALQVDHGELVSDGNSVFEPGETVDVAPAWRSDGTVAVSLAGTASDFTGPQGPDYTTEAPDADYGLLEPGQTASCLDTEVCYQMGVDDTAGRPATHWEATFVETLDDTDGTSKTWVLHIGDSFTDVPPTNLFYASIETLLHSGVTGGCGSGEAYCPDDANSRSQMPVFMLRALMGPDHTPPACVEGNERFHDVPFDGVFCPWIQDLANRGIVSGCGGDNYCPSDPVSRAQMAIFILRTLEGADYEPIECTNRFSDVPCSSLFADWIEDLAARGITGGCTATEYCPGDPVSRAQMAVFITRAFGFTLYGP